jgi:RNA-directed DNA polymerase
LLCNVYPHRADRVWDVREHGVLATFADDAVVRLRELLAEFSVRPEEAETRIVKLEVG